MDTSQLVLVANTFYNLKDAAPNGLDLNDGDDIIVSNEGSLQGVIFIGEFTNAPTNPVTTPGHSIRAGDLPYRASVGAKGLYIWSRDSGAIAVVSAA